MLEVAVPLLIMAGCAGDEACEEEQEEEETGVMLPLECDGVCWFALD